MDGLKSLDDEDQAKGEELFYLLATESYEEKEILLASGQKSNQYIDCKKTILSSTGHKLAGALMLAQIKVWQKEGLCVDACAGVALGGCPLVSAVSALSFFPAVYVRKQVKEHGTKSLVESPRLKEGATIILLEDVITTGGSSLRAVESLREAGFKVEGVIALVDREAGGTEALRESGLKAHAFFKLSDFHKKKA